MRFLLSGATGKVGREIERLVADDAGAEIVARASSEAFFAGDDAGDVLIDFSRPELCARSLEFALAHRMPMVIGTTGIEGELQQQIESASQTIPVCQAANFSLGVTLLQDLVARAAAALPAEFEIEISELHHRWKVDAPSGTALALGRAAAGARGQDHDRVARFDRKGVRGESEIGYQSQRGGDVPGEHTVLFLGDGERLELTHRASDRAIFARGALHAARWLISSPPGLYSMSDVLG
ncbi:MAG: 4-hydroxy-tetrahydrodipicolinate reductase [Wenzhouxiangellaceae bacterium]